MSNSIEVVRLRRLDGKGNTKAFCDISLFDTFIVKGLTVMNGKKGLFVSMPRTMGKDGRWYDNFRPLKKEVKEAIQATVMEAYAA